jgi:hypothetical protein
MFAPPLFSKKVVQEADGWAVPSFTLEVCWTEMRDNVGYIISSPSACALLLLFYSIAPPSSPSLFIINEQRITGLVFQKLGSGSRVSTNSSARSFMFSKIRRWIAMSAILCSRDTLYELDHAASFLTSSHRTSSMLHQNQYRLAECLLLPLLLLLRNY